MYIDIDISKISKMIKEQPERVLKYSNQFLYRAGTRLESKAGSHPWRVGESGGGVPVATGNLLRTHKVDIKPFILTYSFDENKAKYGAAVHKNRPWMDWVRQQSSPQIERDADDMLKNIVEDMGE